MIWRIRNVQPEAIPTGGGCYIAGGAASPLVQLSKTRDAPPGPAGLKALGKSDQLEELVSGELHHGLKPFPQATAGVLGSSAMPADGRLHPRPCLGIHHFGMSRL